MNMDRRPSNASLSSGASADEQDDDPARNEDRNGEETATDTGHSGDGASSMSKQKDPSRPKRKKARRACAACQRAHLTCGDERPCQRCIKRGLAENCQDGARKKAKYLLDAPEHLLPGHQGYNRPNGIKHGAQQDPAPSLTTAPPAQTHQPPAYIPPAGIYGSQPRVIPPLAENAFQEPAAFNPFNPNQSPISQYSGNHQASPLSANVPGQASNGPNPNGQAFASSVFDSSDPNVFGFDLASMNFGSSYGAMEFGMLGHMSGANNNPQRPGIHRNPSSATGYDQSDFGGSNFMGAPEGYTFRNDSWSSGGIGSNSFDHDVTDPFRRMSHIGPNAYAIGAGPGSLSGQSPGSTGAENMLPLEPNGNNYGHPTTPQHPTFNHPQRRPSSAQKSFVAPEKPASKPAGADDNYGRESNPSPTISRRLRELRPPQSRRRSPSSIYSSVTKPYPYTAAFHALTSVLQRRFSSAKRLRIAKALASVRPSFISCTRDLIEEDLIFMERCFLRGLWDYDFFSSACGTPTIVCRRTGEVAHVGKEFSLLTGWPRDVLLGRKPNLNVNTRGGGSATDTEGPSGANTLNSRGGQTTPRVAHAEFDSSKPGNGIKNEPNTDTITNGNGAIATNVTNSDPASNIVSSQPRHQPVFLAELLDDDSVIQFYEDYAKLAFADSKGSASRPCKLLKYRTREDMLRIAGGNATDEADKRTNDPAAAATTINNTRDPSESSGGGKDLSRDEKPRDLQQKHREKRRPQGNIHAEEAMKKMGDKEGKVDCAYCWMVKRDVFNIPMMIVINFLPVIS